MASQRGRRARRLALHRVERAERKDNTLIEATPEQAREMAAQLVRCAEAIEAAR